MSPILKPNVSLFVESTEIVSGSPEGIELGRRCVKTMMKVYELRDMWKEYCGSLGEAAHKVISESLQELLDELGMDTPETPLGQTTTITLLNSSGVSWLNSIHRICLKIKDSK